MPQLRTFMSPVMSRFPTEGGEGPVKLEPVTVNRRQLYWLDEMLEGGLELPADVWDSDHGNPSFVLLLGGPPGTGKTTFALELCYNLATNDQPAGGQKWDSLYVSAETPGNRIEENALRFGWERAAFKVLSAEDALFEPCRCNILGCERVRAANPADFLDRLVSAYGYKFPSGTGDAADRLGAVDAPPAEIRPPDVVVIDSLNLLWPQQAAAAPPVGPGPTGAAKPGPQGLLDSFYRLLDAVGGGARNKRPKLLVIILDWVPNEGPHKPWEFLADAAFRFDWTIGPENYHSRSFQIGKIKTQTHALGNNHVYKIVSGPACVDEGTDTTAESAGPQQGPAAGPDRPQSEGIHGGRGATPAHSEMPPHAEQRRGIPYLLAGGSFVLPSIHWHLSRSIRENPVPGFNRESSYPTGLPKLDAVLGGGGESLGFPSMHTTALVGRRGGMKSHLAYHFMLSHALGAGPVGPVEHPKNVLLVSMRDDMEAARGTLTRLIQQQDIAGREADATDILGGLLRADRLEILYNWPGCVTPNEFFHRIYLALARHRKQTPLGTVLGACERIPGGAGAPLCTAVPVRPTAEIVVLNGLDHLDVKFPLCAGERVFVPALVALFRCFKVCSVVISAEDRLGSSLDIRPLSDLILEFTDATGLVSRIPWGNAQTSRITAVRVPAGQIGGSTGILSRTSKGRMDFYPSARWKRWPWRRARRINHRS